MSGSPRQPLLTPRNHLSPYPFGHALHPRALCCPLRSSAAPVAFTAPLFRCVSSAQLPLLPLTVTGDAPLLLRWRLHDVPCDARGPYPACSPPRSDARLPLDTATGGVRPGLGSHPSSRHVRPDGTRCAAAVTVAHRLRDVFAASRRNALALPSAPRIRVAHPRRVPHSRVGGCTGYPGNPGNGLRPLHLWFPGNSFY